MSSSRPSSPRTLARVLAADPLLADWQRRAARDEAIVRLLRQTLPRAVGHDIRAEAAESGELRLVAPSGAVAAVVRQRGADLKSMLAREGWEFTAIKVTVQPRVRSANPHKSKEIQWDSAASHALSQLRDQLPEGPLRGALTSLLRGR